MELDTQSEYEAARSAALAILARRHVTVHELHEKLRGKGHDEQARDEVVQRMIDVGLLDDEKYAAAFVRARVGRGHGPRRIADDLRRKGIPSDAAAEAMGAVVTEDDFAAGCVEVAKKKSSSIDLSDAAARSKLMRYLAGRGFSMAQIDTAIRALRDAED